DSRVGRFLSFDPSLLVGGASFTRIPSSPQALNAFSYVENRPLIAVDPNGRATSLAQRFDVGMHLVADAFVLTAMALTAWDLMTDAVGAAYLAGEINYWQGRVPAIEGEVEAGASDMLTVAEGGGGGALAADQIYAEEQAPLSAQYSGV